MVLSRDAMRASALATQERLGGRGSGCSTCRRRTSPACRCSTGRWWPGPSRCSTTSSTTCAPVATYLSLVPTQLIRLLEDGSTAHGADPLRRRAGRRWAARPGVRARGRGHGHPGRADLRDERDLRWLRVRRATARRRRGADREDGEVLLRGPMLFDGYEGEPERTAAALQDGWFHTNDLGRLDDDGRLRVTGRGDDVIISGGVKVPARGRGRRCRRTRPSTAVEVLGVPDEEWGERVVAFVVGDRARSRWRELRDAGRRRATWAPRQLVAGGGDPAAAQRQARPGARCGSSREGLLDPADHPLPRHHRARGRAGRGGGRAGGSSARSWSTTPPRPRPGWLRPRGGRPRLARRRSATRSRSTSPCRRARRSGRARSCWPPPAAGPPR